MKTHIKLEMGADLKRNPRLDREVLKRMGYDQARTSALAQLRKGFDLQWTPPASRDELHQR